MVLGLVGSPNREGRTHEIVWAALQGAADSGVNIQLVQLADHVCEACKDCQPWECRDAQKCTYVDEAFEFLSGKLRSCDGLVLGTPVYWSDTSGMVRYLMLKCARVFGASGRFSGLPALGIAVAGGSGHGLVSGLKPLYQFFQAMRMRAIEPLPATRFNWNASLKRAEELGNEVASWSDTRRPFSNLNDLFAWFDKLPYLAMGPGEEKRLLADLAVASLPPDETAGPAALLLAEADTLQAQDDRPGAIKKVNEAYDKALEAFDSR
jgi:multimeric flavodoxin WrbA